MEATVKPRAGIVNIDLFFGWLMSAHRLEISPASLCRLLSLLGSLCSCGQCREALGGSPSRLGDIGLYSLAWTALRIGLHRTVL
jgi:hypothetical protein